LSWGIEGVGVLEAEVVADLGEGRHLLCEVRWHAEGREGNGLQAHAERGPLRGVCGWSFVSAFVAVGAGSQGSGEEAADEGVDERGGVMLREIWSMLNDDDPRTFGAGLWAVSVLVLVAISGSVLVGLFAWALLR